MRADDASDALAPFDFDLPDDRIALRPAEPRGSSRLLVVRGGGAVEDARFAELGRFLRPGDVLVLNDTRVLKAALKGVRPARPQGGGGDVAVNINLIAPEGPDTWRALLRPGKRLREGDRIAIGDAFEAEVVRRDGAEAVLRFSGAASMMDGLAAFGRMPLPPYIERRRAADGADERDYQTVYAEGSADSVAAPTAGLHFTPSQLTKLDEAGVHLERVRLDVGLGTFAPLSPDALASGQLHAERCELSEAAAERLNARRQAGGRVIAVGTTSLRTLATGYSEGSYEAFSGETDIFLKPGMRVDCADGLLTNFHLPRSSLFMLVCALMGTEIMLAAYAHAIKSGYRFYSYGDASLLLPQASPR